MVQLSQRIRQSFSPQPPPTASPSNQGQFSPSDMTTPHPLQAGPRKLKKNDNVKNRMSLAFRKTFAAKPPAPVLRPHAIEAPRQQQHQHRSSSSPSSSLPSYAAASSSPSRGYFGPAPEVNRQGSIGTATREFGRSNKPQPVPAEGLVPRRSHVGAGAVGTSPPLPAIPLPPSKYEGAVRQTFAPPIDGLGIALDLSPTQTRNRTPSPNSSPASQDTLEFPILANVSHVRSSPVAAVSFKPVPAPLDSRPHVEPLRLESSRDRLARTRASISAPSDYTTAPPPTTRGGNRSDPTKCYTMAVAPSFDVTLVRPPKSTLRGLKPLPATLPDEQSLSDPVPSAAAPAWTSRSAPSSRKNSSAVVVTPSAPSAPAGMYCLRPTVHASTQTPDWFSALPSSSRRISSTTPPQAYSSFNGMFGAPVQETQHDITQPSPSVYSISSFDGRSRAHGHHSDRRASRSSFYAATEQIREGDEDLQDVIDRHLGELENGIAGDQHRQTHQEEMETLEVNYDLPFLSATAYDTPQLRPFEIPPTPLALPPLNHSEGLVPSPALTAGAVTPRFDRTPTLPSLSIGVPSSTSSRSITPNQAYSPSSSTSHDSSEPFTPPTSATCSTFDDVSIQLAEQEPIEIRRASLVPSSSRKASLVTTASSYSSSSAPSSRPPSLHYSESSSSLSTKSVKFDIVEQQQRPSVSIIPVSSGSSSSSSSSNSSPLSVNLYPSASTELDSTPEEEDKLLIASQARRRCSESAVPIPRQSNMSREERAAKGRSYFLVQALMGEGLPSEGLIRDWARDSDDEGSDDEGSIADSEM